MPNIVIDLEVDRVDLVDEGANSAAFITFYKRRENNGDMKLEEILAKMLPEQAAIIREELSKSKAAVDATSAELETTKAALSEANEKLAGVSSELEAVKKSKADSKPGVEEVMKNLDPSVQELFKSMQRQKEAAEAALRLAADQQKEAEALAKARELKALPVEEVKLVEVLKSADESVIEVLKAVNSVIENSVEFEGVGKSRKDSTDDNGDAWVALEKKAKEIETRDGITFQKAVSIAMKEYPDLYRKYRDGGAN